jgi:hypothetical protein
VLDQLAHDDHINTARSKRETSAVYRGPRDTDASTPGEVERGARPVETDDIDFGSGRQFATGHRYGSRRSVATPDVDCHERSR